MGKRVIRSRRGVADAVGEEGAEEGLLVLVLVLLLVLGLEALVCACGLGMVLKREGFPAAECGRKFRYCFIVPLRV